MRKQYNEDNLTMLTDFYELTMANGFFQNGYRDQIVYFDMFFRTIPDGGGMAIMAGVEQMLEYLKNLSFTQEDIDYLRGKSCSARFSLLSPGFPFLLRCLGRTGGHSYFPHEPVVTVRGPVIQAQFIETMILLSINHQSLIATKANRIVRASQRAGGHGIRLPPGAGIRRRCLWSRRPISAAATAPPAPSRTGNSASPL